MEIVIPSVELIAAMKLKCGDKRQKIEKRIKDIGDFFALMWYSDEGFQTIKNNLFKIIPRKEVLSIISRWDSTLIDKVAKFIDIDSKIIKQVFAAI